MLSALLDGSPVFPGGPPAWPLPDPDISAILQAAFADGSWGQYHGSYLPRLLDVLQTQFHSTQVLPCASGTLAVEAALRAVPVRSGDEVLLGAYDYEANFLNVIAVGAFPVLVDVAADNATIDPREIEAAVSPRTRAIIVTHLHGGIAPLTEILEIARRHRLTVIEDAAQCAGAMIGGKPAGSLGDIGILSFGGSKLLSAGRGGALLTSRADLAQRARLWLQRGKQQWATLSELQAAVLLPQLEKLQQRTSERLQRVTQLHEAIADVPGLSPLRNRSPEDVPGFYKVGFWFDPLKFGLSRDIFCAAMRAEGVAIDPGFRAFHVGRGASRYRTVSPLTVANRADSQIVILHHPILLSGESAISAVAEAIRKTYRNAGRLSALTPTP